MTDLGFGLVDRRSVLIVIFTIGISNLAFGNSVPIDTSNAFIAFLGFLVLTGFIYATRSILRLVVTLSFAVLRIPFDVFYGFKFRGNNLRGLRGFLVIFFSSIWKSFLFGFIEPSFRRRDWGFSYNLRGEIPPTGRKYGMLAVVDRILLVGIAAATTIPSISNQVKMLGIIGVSLLILVYIINGTFTLILDDAMHRADIEREKQHSEMVIAAKNPNISFPRTITTRPEREWSGP